MAQPVIAKPANRRYRAFCRGVASGMSQATAYRRFISQKGNHPASIASRLVTRFRAHISNLREQYDNRQDHASIMSKREAAQYLTRAARTPLSEIDEDSDLCQEKIVSITKQGTEIKLKSVNKLDAIAQLSKLAGYNEAERVEHTHRVETTLISFVNGTHQMTVNDLSNFKVDGSETTGNPLPIASGISELRPWSDAVDAEIVPLDHQDLPADGLGIGRKVVFKSQLDESITGQ